LNDPSISVLYAINSGDTSPSGYTNLNISYLSGDTGMIFGMSGCISTTVCFARTGDRGDKGQKGQKGMKGQKGDVGITGEKGMKGDMGITGEKGMKGDMGITGEKGMKGDMGVTGSFASTIQVLDSPSGSNLNATDITMFNDLTSFSLDGEVLPQYTLADGSNGTLREFALYDPSSGNVTIGTSQGKFSLTFNNNQARTVFMDGWRQLEYDAPWYVTTQQGNKLVGTGVTGSMSDQGWSVSLSRDGNTLAVGGYTDNTFTGAVWIFTRSGTSWSPQGNKLVGSGAVGPVPEQQGFSVSLSADGNTLAVGGNGDDNQTGAVWIWTRSGGVWSQQGSKLVGSGSSPGTQQGFSVSLSSDGNTVAFGGTESGVGATWIWTRSSGVWSQQQKLVGTGYTGFPRQGFSVSLSSDGNTVAIGGDNDNSGIGASWIWTRSSGIWSQQGNKIVGIGYVGTIIRQGNSVSLSSDGNTLAVGGYNDNNGLGATWIFVRNGGVWIQQNNKLVGTGATGVSSQGYSVSLSTDGNTLAIGGIGDSTNIGAVWIFTRSGGIWTQQGSKLIGSGVGGTSRQGSSVSLSAKGNTLAVGGYSDNSSEGATWIFI
jgi:hypothetical protein